METQRHPAATILALLGLICGVAPVVSLAAEPVKDSAQEGSSANIAGLLEALEDSRFDVRRRAVEQLQRLATQPELERELAVELHRALLKSETSLESRVKLQELLKQLPAAGPPQEEVIAGDEIERAIRQLNDDSYAVRTAAQQQLRSLLTKESAICPLMLQLKQRRNDPELSRETRWQLDSLLDQARAAWLASDPATWQLPPVSDEQVNRWLDDLTAPLLDKGQSVQRRETAKSELIDLLVRDEYRPKLEKLLAERLAAAADPATSELLREVLDWTRPAMVAEIWSEYELATIQHLLVDVPQLPEGSTKVTHFDRIDDQTAHCVSGNTLLPGDYPVGVAVPHPEGRNVIYHLINLPTPRRRLAYEYDSRRDESERLKELSERTVAQILATQKSVSMIEWRMIEQLEPRTVSRFVGPYFQSLVRRYDQRPMVEDQGSVDEEFLEESDVICSLLARRGTQEAIPALEQIAASKLVRSPPGQSLNIAWLAALAIAERDPWRDIDSWLAELAVRDPVVDGDADPSATLNGTAAAMLLERHEMAPSVFGLQLVEDDVLRQFELTGYRFTSRRDQQAFERWWKDRKKIARSAS